MGWKLVVICALLVLPVSCMADELQFGLGLQTSVLSYDEDQLDTSKLFWGGHGRLRVVKYFAGEVSLQKREDNFDFRGGNIELDTVPLQLSAVVYPLGMLPITPVVLIGTGWYFLTATITGDLDLPFVTGEGSIQHTETAWHAGVGVEGFIGEHFSMGGDVRWVFLDFETSIIAYSVDAYLVNIGATFYF